MRWRTLSGDPIPDIEEWILSNSKTGQVVHIGTDSLTRRRTQFVTVVVIHTPTKGGRVAYCRDSVPAIHSLRERLLKEVWRSVEIGMSLNGKLLGELNIHVDANPDERYASSKYVQELVGLVMGQGFTVVLKPDSWAATHASDHIVRSFGKDFGTSKASGGRSPRAVH